MQNLLKTSAILLSLLATTANADPIAIDFRGGDWAGANHRDSYTSGDVTANAHGGNGTLYQDGTDGLGVRGGEMDEIDGLEWLEILIADAYYATNSLLTGVFITDLFAAPDGAMEGETGWVRVFLAGGSDLFFSFHQTANTANGEYWLGFGQALRAVRLEFGSYNLRGHEYSVGGLMARSLTVDEKVAVPEPGTLALLGSGLLLLGLRRRVRRQA